MPVAGITDSRTARSQLERMLLLGLELSHYGSGKPPLFYRFTTKQAILKLHESKAKSLRLAVVSKSGIS